MKRKTKKPKAKPKRKRRSYSPGCQRVIVVKVNDQVYIRGTCADLAQMSNLIGESPPGFTTLRLAGPA